MVPLYRPLVSSYRLSIVTLSLTAAVWPQFATQVFRGGIRRLTCSGSYVNKQVTTSTFRTQATTCSKHHTRTVMDTGCECAPWVRSANPSDSWALVLSRFALHYKQYWRWDCSLVISRGRYILLGRMMSSVYFRFYHRASVTSFICYL